MFFFLPWLKKSFQGTAWYEEGNYCRTLLCGYFIQLGNVLSFKDLKVKKIDLILTLAWRFGYPMVLLRWPIWTGPATVSGKRKDWSKKGSTPASDLSLQSAPRLVRWLFKQSEQSVWEHSPHWSGISLLGSEHSGVERELTPKHSFPVCFNSGCRQSNPAGAVLPLPVWIKHTQPIKAAAT